MNHFDGEPLFAREVSSAGGSMVGFIFGLGSRISNSSRCRWVSNGSWGCCGGGFWNVSGCGFVMSAVRLPGA